MNNGWGCTICNDEGAVSKGLGVCLRCIRERPEKALSVAGVAHGACRASFGLPGEPPRDPEGLPCGLCVNDCLIPENNTGYCGLRKNVGGRLTSVSPDEGGLSWYHDPLPTNCVADWFCPGGTGAGYPDFAYRPGPERGYKNLAVFFHACSFDCLFCQNWHFRNEAKRTVSASVKDLVADVDDETSCICWFGGDPTPQLPFALKASRTALEKAGGRILRICWETNGSMHPSLLDDMIELSLASGGCIKFDIKARDDVLHRALTGTTNQRTLENFRRAAEKTGLRPEPCLVTANTLLVPGYIDELEIRSIAEFIASINPDIPYSMLAFYPHFVMTDLPLTPKSLAEGCLAAAREAGLTNIRLGNTHLLR